MPKKAFAKISTPRNKVCLMIGGLIYLEFTSWRIRLNCLLIRGSGYNVHNLRTIMICLFYESCLPKRWQFVIVLSIATETRYKIPVFLNTSLFIHEIITSIPFALLFQK